MAGRHDARNTENAHTQAGNLFRLMEADQQNRLTSNIAGAMVSVPAEIQQRQIAHFTRAGARVLSSPP